MQLLRSFFTFFTGGFVKKYQNRSAPFSTYGLTKPFYGIDVNNACFDARNISSAEHTQDIKVPTILRNVFLWGRDEWTASLVENMENELIEYDARDNESGDLITYEAIFSEFLSTLSNNSDHFDSMYLMNEDVLERLPKSREYFTLNSTLFGEDLFQYFPTLIKPRTALIIGGEGSRSFLHADPYEWTGWNYLVEGRKLCSLHNVMLLSIQ